MGHDAAIDRIVGDLGGFAAPVDHVARLHPRLFGRRIAADDRGRGRDRAFGRSEEHTSELQSLMRISYAVFCLKKKTTTTKKHTNTYSTVEVQQQKDDNTYS